MSHFGLDAGQVPAGHRFCARSNLDALDRSVSGTPSASGPPAFVATLALILMGDWCGSIPTPLDRDAELLNRRRRGAIDNSRWTRQGFARPY